MSDRSPTEEREELPFVINLIAKVFRGVGTVTLRIVRLISPSNQFRLVGVLVVLVVGGMVYASIRESPDVGGVLRGVGAGLFLGLLTALGGMSLLLWAQKKPARPARDAPRVSALQQLLEPTLRELRTIRRDVIRRVRARSVWCVPVAMALSTLVWQMNSSNPDRPGLLTFLFFGAIVGEMWAAHKLGKEYERLYKDRVLPQLAAQLGDLTYRKPATAEIQKLRTYRILQDAGSITAEDEIVGTYRGLPLSIIEVGVRAKSGNRNRRSNLFDGLVVSLTLPRAMTETTVIAADRGLFGNLRETLRMDGFQRVSLEDPRFEGRFQVYGTDQKRKEICTQRGPRL